MYHDLIWDILNSLLNGKYIKGETIQNVSHLCETFWIVYEIVVLLKGMV